MIVGDRCVSEHIAKQNSTPVRKPRCHSRPRLKHSRAGYSGNPYGTSLHGELVSLEAGYPAYAQWIPSPPSRERQPHPLVIPAKAGIHWA